MRFGTGCFDTFVVISRPIVGSNNWWMWIYGKWCDIKS